MKTLRIALVAMALVGSFGGCKKKKGVEAPAATPATEETVPADGTDMAPADPAAPTDAPVTP